MVECLTLDRGVAGSRLTVHTLCVVSLSKTLLSSTKYWFNPEKLTLLNIVDWDITH